MKKMIFSAALVLSLPLVSHADYVNHNCYAGDRQTLKQNDKMMAGTYQMVGSWFTEPSGGVMDMSSIECDGIWAVMEGKVTGHAYCRIVSPDNATMMIEVDRKGMDGVSRVLNATGKFASFDFPDKYKYIGPFAPVAGKMNGCVTSVSKQ